MATSQKVRVASRKKAKARIGISATAGAGKTMGALLIAYGLTGDWSKVGMVDTEAGSGELYVGHKVPGTTTVIGEYLYWRIDPPYSVGHYIEGQKALEEAGCEAIILDSTSHAWAGAGGLLDKQGRIAASGRAGVNSYTAWREVTPEHNAFVEAMLQSPCHIIATMRSKTEYVLETNEKGKQTPRKVGMAPVQREGMDFEFTIMMDIDANHMATATKDRSSLFDGEYFKLGPDVGRKLLDWLNKGAEEPKRVTISQWLDEMALRLATCPDEHDLEAVLEEVGPKVGKLTGAALAEWERLLAETQERLVGVGEEMEHG